LYSCFQAVEFCAGQEREQFALVFPPTQVKSTLTADELVGEHFSVENYEVGLVVTTCVRTMASVVSEAEQQQLHLKLWLILTNQRELFPRLSLDSRHHLMPRVTPQTRSISDGVYDVLVCSVFYTKLSYTRQAAVAQW